MFPNIILAGTFNQSSGSGGNGGGNGGGSGASVSVSGPTTLANTFVVGNSTRVGNLFIESQNNMYLYTSDVSSNDNTFYTTNGGTSWSQANFTGSMEQTKTAMAFKDGSYYWMMGGSSGVSGSSGTYLNNSNPVLLRSSNPVNGGWIHNTVGGQNSGSQVHANAYRYGATNYFTPQTIKVIPDGQDNGVDQFIFLIFGYEVVSGSYRHGIFRKRSANLDENAYFTKVYQMTYSTSTLNTGNFLNTNNHSPYAIEYSGSNIYARYNIPVQNGNVPNATVWYSSNKGVSFTALSLASYIGSSTEIFHNGAATDGTNWLFTTTADNSGANSDAGTYVYYTTGGASPTAAKYDLTSLANNTNPNNTHLKMPWFGVKYVNGLWFLLNANGRIVYTDDPTDTSSWSVALYNVKGDGGTYTNDSALGNGQNIPNGYHAFESDGNNKLHYIAREASTISGSTQNRINHYVITVT